MSDPFNQARQFFLDGIAHFEAGEFAAAEAAFVASLALLPGRVSTLMNLGATRIKLGRPEAALAPLDEALAQDPNSAECWLHRGVALGALARHEEALACHERALGLQAQHPVASFHRAKALLALHRPADALAASESLLQISSDKAEAWFHHGQALHLLERREDALASYARALALDPTDALTWSSRGLVLKELGRADESSAAFKQAVAHGGDAEMNGFYLAALGAGTTPGASKAGTVPSAPPRAYVQQLFDGYADSFEAHLVGTLRYRAHEVLVAQLQGVAPPRFKCALDLGCGTGLCGPLLKALADRVDGVDLSAPMLDKARALGVYTRLEHTELVEHLKHTDERHDLVVAADVFIYVGALEPVFRVVQRVLERGGLFVFCVEEAGDEVDFELRASLRYAHSRRYLRKLAEQAGFELLKLHAQAIREDQRQPIAGLYAVLRKR